MNLLSDIIVILVWIVQNTEGFPNGAPLDACSSFRPGHGTEAVIDASDNKEFQISASVASGAFDVVLKTMKPTKPFKGFLMKAIPGKYSPANWMDPKLPMGKWKPNPDGKRLDCFRGESNVVTHVDNDLKLEAAFVWVPPKYMKGKTGNVTFVATVVENFGRYYTGVASELMDIPIPKSG